jgi:hydrogenase maturation protein HypF
VRIFHHAHQPSAPRAEGRRLEVRGTVQGVGFRPWVYRVACETDVTGRVSNDTRGVTIEAFGSPAALARFIDRIEHQRPAAAFIETVTTEAIPFEPARGFHIVESRRRDETRVSIPPDLATCPECLGDVRDSANRRHGYAFTNCTNCGPRFTIAAEAPYDRPNTTMAPFEMCAACRREYDAVEDRRFHAQPNACPVCGPRLELRDNEGRLLSACGPSEGGAPRALMNDDPIGEAARALADGWIVAVKGIGGFHLACDAASPDAVARLRSRKRRDEKPFAVMVASFEDARTLAVLSPAEEALLTSVQRPIVLARRRERTALAANVAPDNPLVGLLLAYSPLHYLLLDRAKRPLVMTSGNLSDEPIAYENDEALHRLARVADFFLLHDRAIVTGCDDSIARVIAGAPVVLRRSRGYVPQTIAVRRRFAEPVLACGALLKNTFCLARGDEACLGPHIGDLENVASYRAYRSAIERVERFLDVRPAIAAHDLHPDYLSTRYALERRDVTAIGVQHHHAHVASLMAEHQIDGPMLGVAYDGTGFGTDGSAWGGELLLTEYAWFARVATVRGVALAGADAAVRQPWRTALALVDDAFDGDAPLDALALFARTPVGDVEVVRRMIRQRVNAPIAHGVGRYFDGIGALLLNRTRSAYEGHVALELNMAADPAECGRYRYEIVCAAAPWELDLRPAIRDLVFELIGGEPIERIAARFHNTLAAATVDLVRAAARRYGRLPVGLTGGCFQNARLAESIAAELMPEHRVYLHRRVPPGDGGIALGQAMVANAIA